MHIICDSFAIPSIPKMKWHLEILPTILTAKRRSIDSISLKVKNSNDENFNFVELSNRIKQIKKSESESGDRFTSGLHQRIQELQSANVIKEQFENGTSFLPFISLDALLPKQKLKGSTEDPTFIQLLIDVGLGGWFVMTSLDYRSRKIRRNGVICKVEFIDAAKNVNSFVVGRHSNIPTSVDFVIAGKRRCRVVGKSKSLKLRIGRWRRIYDENGEEALLGWGEEQFLDASDASNDVALVDNNESPLQKIKDSRHWSLTEVEFDFDENEKMSQEMIQKAKSCVPLVDEWYNLASNEQTYQNVNVTATIRIQRNKPFLSVKPDKILLQVLKELGERPPVEDPTAFAFWAAALINPLPALGVSLEIRGKMLEAFTVEDRLNILESGLVRSIQNLKGERPLY